MSGHRAAELLLFSQRISLGQGEGRPCVGHFSWLGMIRTTAWTRLCGHQPPTGFRTLPLANAAQNILIIHKVLSAKLLLALTSGSA